MDCRECAWYELKMALYRKDPQKLDELEREYHQHKLEHGCYWTEYPWGNVIPIVRNGEQN